ncbi:MAG: ABC transporter substrate-binding protein [Clostridiaceae bacterium]
MSFSLSILIIFLFIGCGHKNKTNDDLVTVKLNEVVRSVFYAPMYVAINNGYFEDEGINIELSTGQGADKTMQQVLSGSSDIGFCGPEQIIYIYNQGREDYPVLFAQLTATDGSFLVGRQEDENFEFQDLEGKTIIGGRPGGVPEMTLEYVLRKHGLDPKNDVELITNLDFTATSGAFKAGTGDYVALFEPTASILEQDKSGVVLASIGENAGTIPYTCYFSTKSYISENPEIIEKFTRAIYRGQQYVLTHSEENVSTIIKDFFPGTEEDLITKVVKNYKNINAYSKDPYLHEDDLTRLEDIIQSYDKSLIPTRPPYNEIVDTTFAEKIIDEKK